MNASIDLFPFEFEPRFRAWLAVLGVTPRTAHVTITRDRLLARFGPWVCDTPLANIRDACVTGPYRWYRAIGARGSFADRGATFGTTTRGGACMRFHQPVRALEPFGVLRHPGLTVTVAEPRRLVATLARHGIPPT